MPAHHKTFGDDAPEAEELSTPPKAVEGASDYADSDSDAGPEEVAAAAAALDQQKQLRKTRKLQEENAQTKRKANQIKEAALLAQSKAKTTKRKAPQEPTSTDPDPDYLPLELLQSASEAFQKEASSSKQAKQTKSKSRKLDREELQEGAAVAIGENTVLQHLPQRSESGPSAFDQRKRRNPLGLIKHRRRPVHEHALHSASHKATPSASLATIKADSHAPKTKRSDGWRYATERERRPAAQVYARRSGQVLTRGFVTGKI